MSSYRFKAERERENLSPHIDPGSKQNLVQCEGTLPTTGKSKSCESHRHVNFHSSCWGKERQGPGRRGPVSARVLRGWGEKGTAHPPPSYLLNPIALSCQRSGTRKLFLPRSMFRHEVKMLTAQVMPVLIIISPNFALQMSKYSCVCVMGL